ncbi:hypothetical protein AGR1A_Lc100008 [Agrobacterium fabacearum CFBP 5771]|nr:hypothetical protein AGR1A_Lc100008 [Agrobacterium fabacearum CFBP 5771]
MKGDLPNEEKEESFTCAVGPNNKPYTCPTLPYARDIADYGFDLSLPSDLDML